MRPSLAVLVLLCVALPLHSQNASRSAPTEQRLSGGSGVECWHRVNDIHDALAEHMRSHDYAFAHANYTDYSRDIGRCIDAVEAAEEYFGCLNREALFDSSCIHGARDVLRVLGLLRRLALKNPEDSVQPERLKAYDVVSQALFGKPLEEILADGGSTVPDELFWRTEVLLEASDAIYLSRSLRQQIDDNNQMTGVVSQLLLTLNKLGPVATPDPAWKSILQGILAAPRPTPPPASMHCFSMYLGGGMTNTSCN